MPNVIDTESPLTEVQIEQAYREYQEYLAEESEKAEDAFDPADLPEPFDEDFSEMSEAEQGEYYQRHSTAKYLEWCKKNPLPKKQFPYIVDDIIPAHQVHILAGASGAQKTSILLTLLNDFIAGKPVLGHASHPVPMVFVAFDRGRVATEETFATLGLDHRIFGYVDPPTGDYELIDYLTKLKEANPTIGLFVLDGAFFLAPDVIKRYDPKKKREVVVTDAYKVQGKWLRQLDEFANKHKVTLILIHHAAKNSAAEHAGKRTQIFGSVSAAATTGTTLLCNPVPRHRGMSELAILPRNRAEEKFYFQRQKDGTLTLADPMAEDEADLKRFMQERTRFTRAEVNEELGISNRTASRYIRQAVEDGLLKEEGSGPRRYYVVVKR